MYAHAGQVSVLSQDLTFLFFVKYVKAFYPNVLNMNSINLTVTVKAL